MGNSFFYSWEVSLVGFVDFGVYPMLFKFEKK